MKNDKKADVKTQLVVKKQAPFLPKKRPNDRVKQAAAKGKKTTKRYIKYIKFILTKKIFY